MQQAEDPLGHSAVTATTTTATQPLVVDDAALAAGPGDVAPTSTAQAVAAHETTSTIMPATSTMPSTSTTPLQVPVDTVPRVQPQRPLTATDPLVALASQLSSAAAVGASRPSTAGQFHHSMSTPSRFPLFGGGGGHGNLTLVTGAHALLFGGGGSAGNLSQPASAASMTAAAAAGTITTAGTAVAQAPVPITHREVAQYLIGKDYLLTALEFYTELCEDGREVRELRDYFANHRNFELGAGRYHATGIGGQAAALTSAGAGGGAENHHMRSMSDTYSSMNETISTADEGQSRMSNSEQAEALREKDEYIAVLEYELRQAKDMAEKLKTRLSNMVKGIVELGA